MVMIPLRLGTASWMEGSAVRQALVAPLPSDPNRVVDLNRMERARQTKLGEGRPERLAEVLVASTLRETLEAGPRALQRLRHTLAYAEKWNHRGDLPEDLAPRLAQIHLLPCLPRPSLLCRADGLHLDRLAVQGPGGVLHRLPQPTLAAVGQYGGQPAGFCLAVEDIHGAILGGWLEVDFAWQGFLELRANGHPRKAPLEAWDGIALPTLRPAEVLLLPHPRLKPLPELMPGAEFTLCAGAEVLCLSLGKELLHPTVQ
jgi:hypothetical protein